MTITEWKKSYLYWRYTIYIKYINVVAIVVFVAADEAIHLIVVVNC